MPTILHFADAHIDITNYGRHDPHSGLPLRVVDFLKSLDTIVDTAIDEEVDLVLFAGDAYKDRSPAPTFQREWGKRIMRLSNAGIPTVLLVGNHDLSPSFGRAHAMQAFETLEVPHVHTIDRPSYLTPDDLEGLPLQIIALPWIYRSGIASQLDMHGLGTQELYEQIGERLGKLVDGWVQEADQELPLVLTAHCSIQGAQYGHERTVMLGNDLVLPGSFVRDPRLDYVALGHIHKHQDLNEGNHPPVIYPGSIERVDFGEEDDNKFFVIARVERGRTEVEWRQLKNIRPFLTSYVSIENKAGVTDTILSGLPTREALEGAMFRLVLDYPRDWEALIDEGAIREYAGGCFEFHLVKRPKVETRVRIPQDQNVGSMSPLELLDVYWRASHTEPEEIDSLNKLAEEVLQDIGLSQKL